MEEPVDELGNIVRNQHQWNDAINKFRHESLILILVPIKIRHDIENRICRQSIG